MRDSPDQSAVDRITELLRRCHVDTPASQQPLVQDDPIETTPIVAFRAAASTEPRIFIDRSPVPHSPETSSQEKQSPSPSPIRGLSLEPGLSPESIVTSSPDRYIDSHHTVSDDEVSIPPSSPKKRISNPLSVVERLYEREKRRQNELEKKRKEAEEKELAELEAARSPQRRSLKRRDFYQEGQKFLLEKQRRLRKIKDEGLPKDPECTFQPAISKPPRDMSSQVDVFTRLSHSPKRMVSSTAEDPECVFAPHLSARAVSERLVRQRGSFRERLEADLEKRQSKNTPETSALPEKQEVQFDAKPSERVRALYEQGTRDLRRRNLEEPMDPPTPRKKRTPSQKLPRVALLPSPRKRTSQRLESAAVSVSTLLARHDHKSPSLLQTRKPCSPRSPLQLKLSPHRRDVSISPQKTPQHAHKIQSRTSLSSVKESELELEFQAFMASFH